MLRLRVTITNAAEVTVNSRELNLHLCRALLTVLLSKFIALAISLFTREGLKSICTTAYYPVLP